GGYQLTVQQAPPLVLTVTTTNDDADGGTLADPAGPDGTLSLREAIQVVNSDFADSALNRDTINFNTGQIINLSSILPEIQSPVIINGARPNGANTVLNGQHAGAGPGLEILGGNSTVNDFGGIQFFTGNGVDLFSNNNTVQSTNIIR